MERSFLPRPNCECASCKPPAVPPNRAKKMPSRPKGKGLWRISWVL